MTMEQLKDAFKEKTLTYGLRETLKKVKTKKVDTVFVAKDCPEDLRQDLTSNAKISGVNIIELDISSQEIGAVCKKPFPVTVLCY
jgi:large subunit ribosomal protein L30e